MSEPKKRGRKPGSSAAPRVEMPADDRVTRFEGVDTELESFRRMEATGEFYYPLPNGQRIECATADEYEMIKRSAKPYIDHAEEISADSWNDIAQYMINSLNYYVISKELTEIRRRGIAAQNLKDDADRETLERYIGERQADLVRQMNTFQKTMTEQRMKLDPTRLLNQQDGVSLDETLARYKADAVEYANTHKGEFVWTSTCPNPECIHYDRPYTSLQQSPHFAFDYAASPYEVWNEEVYLLVRKRFKDKKDYDEFDNQFDSPGISFRDAAKILRTSPIGAVASVWERQKDGNFDFPIDLELVINRPSALAKYTEDPKEHVFRKTDEDVKESIEPEG